MIWWSRLCNLVPQRGWFALGNGEGQENSPRGRWEWCRQEPCTPSHPFSSITPLTYIVQLKWLTSTPNSSLPSFSTPSFVIYDKTLTMSIIWLQQNHVDWILPSSPLERTQCRQGNMRSTSYYCNMCGDCSTNWNCCLIDVGKTTGPTLQWCACPFDDSFAICSQTSLIIDPGSLLHTSQGPRVTVRVFSKDDEVNELGGSEES